MRSLTFRFARVLCLALPLGCAGAETAPEPGPPAVAGEAPAPVGAAADLDVSGIIDRAGRALAPVADRPGAVGTEDGTYRFEAVGAAGELTLRDGVGADGRVSEPLPPLRFETESVRLGDRELGMLETIAVQENTLVLSRSGGVVERIAARRGQVEQTWELASPPADGADATIFVAVAGLPFAGESLEGLHFLDRATGLGFRYGHATAIDAAGERLDVRAQASEGGVLLQVPGTWLAGARYPVVVDPILMAELGMDTPVGTGPAAGNQQDSAVAAGGGNFLVVWEDLRAGATDADIFGTRVSPAGAILDSGGIPIAVVTGGGQSQLNPDVAFDGTNFLVVWDDNRNGAGNADIFGARIVAATGANLDPTGLLLATGNCNQTAPSVAFDGTGYLVVWQAQTFNVFCGGNQRIQSTLVSTAGVSSSPSGGVAVVSGTNAQGTPDTAWNGQNFVVVWQENRGGTGNDIAGARVTSAGTVVGADAAGRVLSAGSGAEAAPALASDGTNALLVWQDNRNGNNDILGYAVDRTLATSCPAAGNCPIEIEVSTGPDGNPAIAWAGSYLVAWESLVAGPSIDIRARRYDAVGAPVGTGPFNVVSGAGLQTAAAVGGSGTTFLTAWTDGRAAGTLDIWGTPITADTVAIANGARLTDAAPDERAPVVASDGAGYLVVWQDLRNGTDLDIFAVPVTLDASGQGVAGAALHVAGAAPTMGNQRAPSVAYGGGRYLVAWQDDRNGSFDIFAARVAAGAVVDATGFLVSNQSGSPGTGQPNAQITPAVAYNYPTEASVTTPREFIVVWDDNRSGFRDLWATSIAGDTGVVITNGGFQVSNAAGNQLTPDVAMSDGTGAVVVFRDELSGTVVSRAITRTATTGADVGLGVAQAGNPALAWNGTHFLAVWQDNSTQQLVGRRMDAGGNPGCSTCGTVFNVSAAAGAQTVPDVAWDGDNDWYVVWQDARNGNPDIYTARVPRAGGPREATGRAVITGSGQETAPAVASLASWNPTPPLTRRGRGLFAYEAQRGGAAARIMARPFKDFPSGDACTANTDCDSDICVDGVCCNTACGGGDATDCQACSHAAGLPLTATEGTCGPVKAAQVCRAGNGVCDPAETCDGSALACPAPAFASTSTPCGDATYFCRDGETCDGSGACNPSSGTPHVCSDGNLCHAGTCNEATDGCEYTNQPAGTSCEGTFFCRLSETCDAAGACDPASGVPRDCSDPNLCHKQLCDETADACDNSNQPVNTSCEGTYACRTGELCNAAGNCEVTSGAATNCADGTICTADSCMEPGGCVHTPAPVGTPCDNDFYCVIGETCNNAGGCDPSTGTLRDCSDPNVCHKQVCDEAADACDNGNVIDGTGCADATVCNGAETCQAGTCSAGAALVCADTNPCTADSCNALLGCQNLTAPMDGMLCADSDLCDGAEYCNAGSCGGGLPVVCNDSDACTMDTCVPTTGACSFTPDPACTTDAGSSPDVDPDADPDTGTDTGTDADPDAGIDAPGPDVPTVDAPVVDAPTVDTPAGADAGPDGTITTDGSAADGPRDGVAEGTKPPAGGSGCDCTVPGPAPGASSIAFALLGLAAIRRRRRG